MITKHLASLIIGFLLVVGSNFSHVYAGDAEDTRAVTTKSATVPKSNAVAIPASPKAGGAQSGSGSPEYTHGCCSPPTPFPGLYCCDTQDCGWFSCDNVRQKDKKHR